VAALASFAIIISMILIFLRKETDSGSFVTYDEEFLRKISQEEFPIVARLISFLKYLIKKDFISFLFFIIAAIGSPLWILYICSAGGLIAVGLIAHIHLVRWLRAPCDPEISL
jgi:hypothetical protein